MSSSRVPEAIGQVFTATFTARDVAEPLASFDGTAPAAQVRAFMEAEGFDVVALRQGGQVVGFVQKDRLTEGLCEQHQQSLDEAKVLSESAPLLTVIIELNKAPFLLVRLLGSVAGIITPSDLQKPPVRMWLFGIVTLVEMRFAELIERHCPGDTWQQYLSEARLQKTQTLLMERSRRNLKLNLVDCLQFSDKGQIIARNEEVRKLTVFTSRTQAEEAIKRLEQLRNNLAHAQDILTSDWGTIIQLCEFIAHQ